MIDFLPIVKIAPIFAVALVSPGPAFLLTSSTALSYGRSAGVKAACGLGMSDAVYAALCLLGLGIVFTKMQGLVIVVRIFGGAYLMYLGYQLWKASFRPRVFDPVPVDGKGEGNPFMTGFLTNMTNPKAIAFYTSIFALVMPRDASYATQALIVLVMGMMSLFWFSFVSFCLSAPSMRRVYTRWSQWIDRGCGTVLALFGARLLFSTVRN